MCESVFNGRLGDCFGGTESQCVKRKKKIDVWAWLLLMSLLVFFRLKFCFQRKTSQQTNQRNKNEFSAMQHNVVDHLVFVQPTKSLVLCPKCCYCFARMHGDFFSTLNDSEGKSETDGVVYGICIWARNCAKNFSSCDKAWKIVFYCYFNTLVLAAVNGITYTIIGAFVCNQLTAMKIWKSNHLIGLISIENR